MKLENAQAAMQIILHAGDARLKTAEALKSLKTFDIERAKQQLLDAKMKILWLRTNHRQLSAQAESNGEEIEYSILFTHAQDTCMTVCSEINIAQQLVELFAKQLMSGWRNWKNRSGIFGRVFTKILELEERYELL